MSPYANQTYSTGTDLKTALRTAVRITSALWEKHRAGFIHGSLNPGHILSDPDTGSIVLTGFDTLNSPDLPPNLPIDPPIPPRDDPAYTAPERTGRLNHSVDQRSDLYSFGIILFELVLGRVPFMFDDPSQVIHAHLARDPFTGVDPAGHGIPPTVVRIIKKLLSKDPLDRYSDAAGLGADLENCLAQLESCGTIDDFLLDQTAKTPRFRQEGRFYGRARELKQLHRIFFKNSKKCGLVLVSGVSGIGKTAFVRTFCNLVKNKDNQAILIISGKYDQVRQDTPYSALADALRQFVHQALTQRGPVFEKLQADIKKALGSNGRLMVDMIPELEWIIGPQPGMPEMNIAQTRNRFLATFIRFLTAISGNLNRFILFLDDLQWVDAGSRVEMTLPPIFTTGP